MIVKQELRRDEDGTMHLRNTMDYSGTIAMAKEANERETGQGKNGYLMGFIPEEMKMYDPWLKAANRAAREGDHAKYTDYMIRFFRVHSAFAYNTKRIYFKGYNVPVIDKSLKRPEMPDAMSKLLKGTP
jgi:hypothetical protein